jgi:hypothetical protein
MPWIKLDSSQSGSPAAQDGEGGRAVAGRVATCSGRDRVPQRCAGILARASQVRGRVISTTVHVDHGGPDRHVLHALTDGCQA